MSKDKDILPSGYRPNDDLTRLVGRLTELSPAQKELRSLMVRDDNLKNKRNIDNQSKPPYQKIRKLSDIISNNIQAQTDLRTLTPYIRRAEQIWKTLLLKPNGLDNEILTFSTIDSEIKNSALHDLLLQRVKVYFTTTYPIEETLPDIVSDVMFKTGSYVIMDLSHAALDHMINGMDVAGNENFKSEVLTLEQTIKQQHYSAESGRIKNIGWIRKEKSNMEGFESLFAQKEGGDEFNLVDPAFNWTFTDNPVILKMGELKNKIVKHNLLSRSGVEGLDSIIKTAFTKKKNTHKTRNNSVKILNEETYEDALKRIYPDRDWGKNEDLYVRKNIYYGGKRKGNGITYHIPSEACIPVHINGEKNKPIGFVLLTDLKTGEFLKSTGDIKFYSSYKNRKERNTTANKTDSLNSIISGIKDISQGRDCEVDMDWAIDMVNGLLEKEIIESFLNGDRAMSVSVTLTEENKKIYLSRAFKQQGVRSVFVPAEAITYFALDYSDFGVGKSLVDEAKPLITRLALLEIANTVASLENAIPKSLLEIDLEEENFNPTELIEMVRVNYLSRNPSILDYVGFSSMTIDKQIEGIKNASVRIKINANENNTIINPNVEERQDEKNGLKPIDTDTIERLLNELSGHFDLKRSWLEDSEQGNDFAIEALADQELLMNICVERSRAFSKFISEHISKHIGFNEDLLIDLINIIKDNKTLYLKPDMGGKNPLFYGKREDLNDLKEESVIATVLKDFINNISVKLPIPMTVEQYGKMADKIKAAGDLVDAWKEQGIAEGVLRRVLTDMGLETSENAGDENSGTNTDYILSLVDSIMRKIAYRKLGVTIALDEIVADGQSGGVVSLANEAVKQRDNVAYFVETVFKGLIKGNKKLVKIGEKYKDGLLPPEYQNDNEEYNDEPEENTDTGEEDEPDVEVNVNVDDEDGDVNIENEEEEEETPNQ